MHSLSDLISDVAVLAGLRMSARPADHTHPWGHRRVSTMVAMVVGALLLGLGCAIALHAITTYHVKHPAITSPVPLVLALVTIPAKEMLFHLTRRVGRAVGDVSLAANAWHHRSDAFSSIAAAAGLTVVAIGGQEWSFVDELTALVLSAFLIAAAARIMWSAASELVDRAPSRAIITAIERAIADTDGVRDHHAIRARQIGGKVTMDVHVLVDPDLTVREGHDIADAVQQSIQQDRPERGGCEYPRRAVGDEVGNPEYGTGNPDTEGGAWIPEPGKAGLLQECAGSQCRWLVDRRHRRRMGLACDRRAHSRSTSALIAWRSSSSRPLSRAWSIRVVTWPRMMSSSRSSLLMPQLLLPPA